MVMMGTMGSGGYPNQDVEARMFNDSKKSKYKWVFNLGSNIKIHHFQSNQDISLLLPFCSPFYILTHQWICICKKLADPATNYKNAHYDNLSR